MRCLRWTMLVTLCSEIFLYKDIWGVQSCDWLVDDIAFVFLKAWFVSFGSYLKTRPHFIVLCWCCNDLIARLAWSSLTNRNNGIVFFKNLSGSPHCITRILFFGNSVIFTLGRCLCLNWYMLDWMYMKGNCTILIQLVPLFCSGLLIWKKITIVLSNNDIDSFLYLSVACLRTVPLDGVYKPHLIPSWDVMSLSLTFD